jgi:hypothetical protein
MTVGEPPTAGDVTTEIAIGTARRDATDPGEMDRAIDPGWLGWGARPGDRFLPLGRRSSV